MKKIIGFTLLTLVLGGFVVITCIQNGVAEGLLIWLIAIVLTLIIVGAVLLITSD